jgi:hypothetical protein
MLPAQPDAARTISHNHAPSEADACSLPKFFLSYFSSYVGFVPVSNLLAIFVDASIRRRFGL